PHRRRVRDGRPITSRPPGDGGGTNPGPTAAAGAEAAGATTRGGEPRASSLPAVRRPRDLVQASARQDRHPPTGGDAPPPAGHHGDGGGADRVLRASLTPCSGVGHAEERNAARGPRPKPNLVTTSAPSSCCPA